MSDTTFTPGQRVYSVDGAAGLFVAKVDEGFIVRPLYGERDLEEDDEAYPEGAALWRTAHPSAPVERFDTAIQAMNKKLDSLRAEVRELETKKYAFERVTQEQRDRIKEHDALKPLDDLLAGRVTHFVVTKNGRFGVFTVEQATKLDKEWYHGSQLRLSLVSSHSAPSGLVWKLSQESRGYDHEVLPFVSEASAMEKCRALIAARLQQLADDTYFNSYSVDEPVNAAQRYGVPVPEKLQQRILAHERAAATAARDKAAKELAAAEAKLSTATPATPA